MKNFLFHPVVSILIVLILVFPFNAVVAKNVPLIIGDNSNVFDKTYEETPIPKSVIAVNVSAGTSFTCALTTSGGVKCWGKNGSGQLGDGTTINRSTPVDVVGLASGVSVVAAGRDHTCALTTSGGVKCWGNNGYGQLGDGTTSNRSIPVDVVGLASGVSAVAAGRDHTCAITTSGGVKCWGHNHYGQLGDGTTIDRLTSVDVVGLASGVGAISTGEYHTCALTTSGSVKCWGENNWGQLGDGTHIDRYTAVDVVGFSSGVSAIAAGGYHACSLIALGGVRCWGSNIGGQLGDGTTIDRSTAVDVVGLSTGVSTVTAGEFHTCALTASGGIKCWGYNDTGQLGDGTTVDRYSPVDVVGLSSGVSAISASTAHTCALTTTGGVKCWGTNWYGQLGDGTTSLLSTPVDVVGLSSEVSAIAAGESHTCAVTASGGVKCWGNNAEGQLGDGTTSHRSTPVDVVGLTSGVSAVAAGFGHTCALTTSGGIKCWGRNDYGQLGDGSTTHRSTPIDVSGLISGVSAISAGGVHTCALTTSGGVKCWGRNFYGQIGDGTYYDRPTPVDVVGLTNGASGITAGGRHTCALTTSGGVKCWGFNDYGQLGDGTFTHKTTPVDVDGLTGEVSAVSAGESHTCTLTTTGGVKCWGYNYYGQIGDGTTSNRSTPVDVVGLANGVDIIAVGRNHTCGFTTSDGVKCWGSNYSGQLGDGTYFDRSIPVDVVGLSSGVNAVIAGGWHSCALTTSGSVKCWGLNDYGQLGYKMGMWLPVDVVGFGQETSAKTLYLPFVIRD